MNPLTIRMVRSLAEVPRDMKDPSAQGKSLEALVEEQRLFILDYVGLVQVLTTILFQTSAFHSAVNFPQAEYLVYVPNRPDATLAKMPEGDADITLDFIFLNAMPSFGASSFQISFAILLTVPPDATLTNDTALAKDFPEIYERYQKRLAQIAAELRARNDALAAAGQQPYPYLPPERIAASVAI